MKSPRSTGFSLIFKNKIYIFGGYTSEKKRSKVIEVYDPAKNYWENLNVILCWWRLRYTEESRLAWYFHWSLIKFCWWVVIWNLDRWSRLSRSIWQIRHIFGTLTWKAIVYYKKESSIMTQSLFLVAIFRIIFKNIIARIENGKIYNLAIMNLFPLMILTLIKWLHKLYRLLLMKLF